MMPQEVGTTTLEWLTQSSGTMEGTVDLDKRLRAVGSWRLLKAVSHPSRVCSGGFFIVETTSGPE